jgi:hypothetical protein
MTIDIDQALAPYVASAIRALIRQLGRDGYPPPADLEALAITLMRDGALTAAQRRRALSARRSARYRARQRERQAAAAGRQLSA